MAIITVLYKSLQKQIYKMEKFVLNRLNTLLSNYMEILVFQKEKKINIFMEDQRIQIDSVCKFKFALFTSSDVEKSFSRLKAVLLNNCEQSTVIYTIIH